MTFSTTIVMLALAAKPDAGSLRLSAAECSALLDAMMTVSVNESLSADPEVKKMNAELKAATKQAAVEQALKDPQLSQMKADCPARYTKDMRDCIMKAKTMVEVDECSTQGLWRKRSQ